MFELNLYGIEIKIPACRIAVGLKSLNWTFMELKYMKMWRQSLFLSRLNWTFMELKLRNGGVFKDGYICLNWTFMELKFRLYRYNR